MGSSRMPPSFYLSGLRPIGADVRPFCRRHRNLSVSYLWGGTPMEIVERFYIAAAALGFLLIAAMALLG
jgi:hypothetical protein